mgnify:CR=1 FL=1
MKKTKKSFWKSVKESRILLLMLAPAVIYVILFSYLPMFGIVLAFKDYNYVDGIFGSPWNGFDNFQFLILSKKLWPLTRNTMLYNIAFISLGVVLQVLDVAVTGGSTAGVVVQRGSAYTEDFQCFDAVKRPVFGSCACGVGFVVEAFKNFVRKFGNKINSHNFSLSE